MSTRRSTEAVGEDSVVAATGRPRPEWFALLDDAGATGWPHPQIAAWLVDTHGVDGWWAQSVTVAYEQERGLRAPGQRRGGHFEAAPSKTLPGTVKDWYPLLADAGARARWLDPALPEMSAGERSEVAGGVDGRSVRIAWPVGAVGAPAEKPGSVVLDFYQPRDAAGEPTGRVRLSATHRGIPTAEDAATLKQFWRARLADLAALGPAQRD
ncbi:hypothetical protein [Puerhibacterium sp. TATVAM-FAB25]|uniref:hypothetical protein n=1 Tax=Puerhibacterium sp. TATVAM-FAB25 TaxID=3093699 RepID=UPI00397D93FF